MKDFFNLKPSQECERISGTQIDPDSDPNITDPMENCTPAPAKRPLDPATDSATPKRRPSSSTTSTSTATASSSVEILFRILCPADKIGGVIGKGGSIISKIREETRTKIRIEDPVHGSDDRVILINPVDSGDASLVQAALVRVLERVEEGKEVGVCRLLVGGGQIGCVLGKGGKIVERIRGESGAQIKILGKEQLPQCAAAGDVLVNVRKLPFLAVI